MIKNPPANTGDARNWRSFPGLGRSPGKGNDNPLQCSCWENLIDRGTWQATVHGGAESDTTEPLSMHTYAQIGCCYLWDLACPGKDSLSLNL